MRTLHTQNLTLGEYKLIGYYSLIKPVIHWAPLKRNPLQNSQQEATVTFQH